MRSAQPGVAAATPAADESVRQILDQASTAIVVKDLDGRYLFVNREFERLRGRSGAEIVGKLDSTVMAEEAARRGVRDPQAVAGEEGRWRAQDRQVIESRRAMDFEDTIETELGRRTFISHRFPLLDASGEPHAVGLIATDITDRRRLEDALRGAALAVSSAEGEAVFRELVRYLATMLDVDAAFIAVHADPGRTRMRTLASWLDGRHLREFEYDLEGSPCAAVVGREFRFSPAGVNGEFPAGTLFRNIGIDSYAALPLNDARGEPIGLIAAMDRMPIRDAAIFEAVLKIFATRVAGEIERRRAVDALAESEASHRSIFEASADAIFIHDWETGRILDVSPAAEAMYGWSAEELKRLSVEDISAADEGYTQARALAEIDRARRDGAILFEWRTRHRSGRKAWHEVRIKPAVIAGKRRLLAYTRDITDRKAADEALRASESQYRAIFEASQDGLALGDDEGRLVDVNPAFLRLVGATRDEVVGRDGLRFILPSMREESEARFERAIAGEPCQAEAQAVRTDGTVVDVEIHGVPMRYLDRPHVLVVVRDLTERKRAEHALRASEEQYRAIFNASADAMVLWDADYRRVDVNAAYERLYGWSRDEVIGRAYEHPAFAPEYARLRLDLVRRALAGEACHAELEAIRKDGERLPTEFRAIPFEHLGRPHVLTIARDITERKRAEQALQASEEQYRAIFNASADALMLWNKRLQRVDVNPAHAKIFGYAREDVVGRGFEGLGWPEDLARARIEMVRRALDGEASRVEAEAMRKDGRSIVTELRTIPYQHRGEPHVLQIARDITERRAAEREREALEDQLRQAQKMEAIGHLTGGIAHDFNNLLTSIMGYIALASERDSAEADPKLARHLEQALASCGRARDLIQQMLMFSRGKRGERRPVALAPLARESVKLLRASFPAGVDIETDLDDATPAVLADPVQLDQVLMNLAINARDAIGSGGRLVVRVRRASVAVPACASCRKAVAGDFVELAVEDSGPGIAPAVAERMFEPFYTTKEFGRGTGMGLATVHGIVHDLGGHVVVASSPGKGATFRVLLPAAADGSAPAASASDRGGRNVRPALAGRVALVEDEASVAAFMRERIEQWGAVVQVHATPQDALVALSANPGACDVVLTDLSMPGMTGMELATRLRAAGVDAPILLYTGYGEGVTPEAMRAAGVERRLTKPVDPDELHAALAASLGSSRAH